MSVSRAVGTDEQLVRVLQIGVVLEELVEARAFQHYRSMTQAGEEVDAEIEELLMEAREESGEHRQRLESLIESLDADSVPYDQIEALVREKYGHTKPADMDGVLNDQLTSEETAYQFYDSVIEAIEASDAGYDIDRDRLLTTLREIRDEEAEGVEEVSEVIDAR